MASRQPSWETNLRAITPELMAIYISDIEADILDELDGPLELICSSKATPIILNIPIHVTVKIKCICSQCIMIQK
jgi:hypothetical protein